MSSKRNSSPDNHIYYMDQALSLAKINQGLTGENPSVGCVLVKKDQIISSGVTGINGRPHAEVNAINNSKEKVNGSTLYVTLEPCNHYGKTPPCTNLIKKKKIVKKIFIYEKSKSNVSKIKKLRLPGIVIDNLDKGAINYDLIIFCTPMSEYKNLILKINNFITPKTLITDIGSSKVETSRLIKKFLKKNISWTQSHPIAGSEVSGPEHGKENMFQDRWCILIKEKNTKKKYLDILNNFWKKMGSKVIVMTPEKHDRIFSITSHLPHLIAYNLVKSAQDFEKKQNYDLIKFSAGGLRDFSRIAASNEIMWRLSLIHI